MTRDFLVKFKNSIDLENAARLLSTVKFNDHLLFGEIEKRKNSLFITLTYSNLVTSKDELNIRNKKLVLSNEFVFVAIKNAYHDPSGYVFTNFTPQIFKSGDHVSNIGVEVLKYFEA